MDFEGMDTTVRSLVFGGLFLVALAAVLWPVYDWQTRWSEARSPLSVVCILLAAVGAVAVLPALVINAFNLDVDDQDLIDPLSYVGIAGVVVAVAGAVAYAFARDTEPLMETEPDIRPRPDPEPDRTEDLSESEREEVARRTRQLRREKTPQAQLWLSEGPGAPERTSWDLYEVASIGADERSDITLDDEFVSAEHARIRFDEERKLFEFQDLFSANGSWLITTDGKERIEGRHTLSDGDRIEIGKTQLVFKQDKPPASSS